MNRNIINSSIIKIIRNKLEETGLRFSIDAEKYLINKIKKNVQIGFRTDLDNNSENKFQPSIENTNTHNTRMSKDIKKIHFGLFYNNFVHCASTLGYDFSLL